MNTERIDQDKIPKKTLSSGEKIPSIGLGTFGSDKYGAAEVAKAVYGAVKFGYRLIDCAQVYQNEAQIGEVLEQLMREKVVKREELFIISKVWNDMHDKVHIACRQSLKDLRLDYLDLYLVHWPFRNYHAPGCDVNYRNPDAKPFSVDEYMETWRQCEELVEKGLVRYIGMSNMTIPKLEAVLPLCRIKPAVLEMELHPSFQQPELFDYAVSHNMLPIGYCPLGSPSRPERDRTKDDVVDMELPAVVNAARAHGVHPAAICLKWAVQRGQVPIPFSVKEHQYKSNLTCITEDPLTEEEMEAIRLEDRNCRLIKGQVFLWNGAKGWEDLWDVDGKITGWD
ncbi:2,5-diketo-D-gluconic acid reductase A [Thermoclostridium stercorarium subsp. stercorarium DSM 8532]|jgi:alcohol dehydrogenase (NADP+)|uniref:2,5-diketo-D-gluconic acid reductase A n=3 Tax=Thermoclostridium stercorarium TaxID=1510 RepID=L7VL05_THES1|nr:aldo/keto reductase [Thermoclostridium stercorarium]AGC67131.1 2,5-diketo-D-gluconic acid reductase A [Thermoclostridium stercorarium subsp. stercorarium DSM 8532]AGI38211.1 aldo/keto reductase [Thermoclostridium stercorarium subsp. stercorarium DSM 8532]ANW97617.1 aldehyde oxidoreductase [Thermoclostridium stercorarium subsp. thermolacticum DSM 2910]ANX00177.1 aldehyde oxidoreductase [Thermoclostridium stercorarium subsp. leptospartum DSM 9219]UZQ85730.1 aldo/keto reductase [Thermoclostrid